MRMENGGQYRPDYLQGLNMLPQHEIKEQHNALVMNKKIMSILAERDAAVRERDQALSAKKEALAARDEAIQQRDKALIERDKALIERENAFAALQHHENSLNFALSGGKCYEADDDDGFSIGETHELVAFPLSTLPPELAKVAKRKKAKGKKVGEDLNLASPGKKCKTEWDSNDVGLNFDERTMPVPVCTCTGSAHQCYKWGSGGWQSSCCTTTLSQYPLPQMPNKKHSRVGGRKMSGNVFSRLLSRLAGEGYDLSCPVDLKDYWARHGTNRYITIKNNLKMNKDQEKGTVKQVETAEMRCVARTRAFLEIPNPEIVKVLAISSSATFTSGIALAFEWLFHGRSHTGFGWIIYYALFLICLPLLILIGLRVLMAISCPSSHGSSSQTVVDSVAAAKEECVEAQQTEGNSCRSLAVVVDSDERKKKNRDDEKKPPTIKRAVSFPSHGKVRSCRTR